jgi:hypothetical protein
MRLSCLFAWFWPLSFGRAYFLSLIVLLLFVLWIVFDCSFHWIPPIVGQDLRFQFLSDPNVAGFHSWDFWGPRLLVFAILAFVALTATVMVFARILVGSEAERSIKSMLLATALVAFWLSLFASYNQLWWLAFRYRVLRYHDAMKASVAVLSEHWPTEKVALPGLGPYVVSGQDPNLLFTDSRGNPFTNFTEVFDRIGRRKNGDFSFAVQSCPGTWIHYMREGRSPESYTSALPGSGSRLASYKLQHVTELRKNWYLAQYEITVEHTATSPGNGKQVPTPPPTD